MKNHLGTLFVFAAVLVCVGCQADAVDNGNEDTANDSVTMDMPSDTVGDAPADTGSDSTADMGGDTTPDTPPDLAEDMPSDTAQDMGSGICEQNISSGCLSYCQFTSDCIAVNSTLSGLLTDQLTSLGFDPMNLGQCAGCITVCETDEDVGGTIDEAVLTCIADDPGVGTCGSGLDGAAPWIDAVDSCCNGQTSSEVCARACAAINEINPALSGTCMQF